MDTETLTDEQERVQKKTFTKWFNAYLEKRECQWGVLNATKLVYSSEKGRIKDLFTDIRDGVKLLNLLEVLGKTKLPTENAKNMQRVHHLSNIQNALRYLESKNIKLVNINPADIADGKPNIVLGLMWTIILHFQIEQDEALNKNAQSGKKALLQWSQGLISVNEKNIEVTDFTSSWRDGRAFSALVHKVRSDLINMDQVFKKSNRENLEHVFNIAEVQLGIPRLLDPEDVDQEKPDEKSIITYITQFLKAFPNGTCAEDVKPPPEEKERLCLKQLNDFLRQAKAIIPPKDSTVQDLEKEHSTCCRVDIAHLEMLIMPAFRLLCERWRHDTLTALSKTDVEAIMDEWDLVDNLLAEWRWRLDSLLPGDFRVVAHWLCRAERWIKTRWDYSSDAEAARVFAGKLLEHNDIFKDMDAMDKKFQEVRKSPLAKQVKEKYLASLGRRFIIMRDDEPGIFRKLECFEVRYRLMVHAAETTKRLEEWTNVANVEEMETSYRDYEEYVLRGGLFTTVDKAKEEFRRASQLHCTEDLTKEPNEVRLLEDFRLNFSDDWNEISKEVRLHQSLLQDIIKQWKIYNQKHKSFDEWLTAAEASVARMGVLDAGLKMNEGQQHYDDTNLIATSLLELMVRRRCAVGVMQSIEEINTRWSNLKTQFDDAVEAASRGENKILYENNTSKLKDWMTEVDGLLAELQRDDIPALTYRKTLNTFQGVVKNRPTGDALTKESLSKSLRGFAGTLSPEESAKLDTDLNNLFHNLEQLDTNIDDSLKKSPVKADCFEYNEKVIEDKKVIEQAKAVMDKQPPPDDIESVLKLLEEQEALLDNLDNKSSTITGEIAEGNRLKVNPIGESIVGENAKNLESLWAESNIQAKNRLQVLKATADSWKVFEAAKKDVDGGINASNTEMSKPVSVSGLMAIKTDLKAKDDMKKELLNLKPTLAKMKQEYERLKDKVSPAKRQEMEKEIAKKEKEIIDTEALIETKTKHLVELSDRWSELYDGMSDFDKFLAAKQKELEQLNSDKLSPEDKMKIAKKVMDEIEAAKAVIQKIETEGGVLTKNVPKSREVTSVSNNIEQLSKKYSQLAAKIALQANNATDSLTKIRNYQELATEMTNIFKDIDTYLNAPLPKVLNQAEIDELIKKHKEFGTTKLAKAKDLFDKLDKVSQALTGQPKLQDEFDKTAAKWGIVNDKFTDRGQLIDQMKVNLTAFEKERDTCDGLLQELRNSILKTDNLPSDKQLVELKKLTDKQKPIEKKIISVSEKLKVILPSLSPEGNKTANADKVKLDTTKKELDTLLNNKMKGLQGTLQGKSAFSSQLADFKAWLASSDNLLQKTQEIFSDEVPDFWAKLKVVHLEMKDAENQCTAITKQMDTLCSQVTGAEADVIRREFGDSAKRLNQIGEMVKLREEVCEKWTALDKAQKEWNLDVKQKISRLNQASLREDDLAKMEAELTALKTKLPDFTREADEVQAKEKIAKMKIKNRGEDGKVKTWKEILDMMLKEFDKIRDLLASKSAHFDTVAKLWENIKTSKDDIMKNLAKIKVELNELTLIAAGEKDIQNFEAALNAINLKLTHENDEIKKLVQNVDKLSLADPTKSSTAREHASTLQFTWSQINDIFNDKKQILSIIKDAAGQHKDLAANCHQLIDKFTKAAEPKIELSSAKEVKQYLDQIKQTEQQMVVEHRNFDTLANKSQLLINACSAFPKFDKASVTEPTAKIVDAWKALMQRLESKRIELEGQMTRWEKLKQTDDELKGWLDTTIQKLTEASTKSEETVTVEGKLKKYRNDLSYYEELRQSINKMIIAMKDAAGGKLLSDQLDAVKYVIDAKFIEAENLAKDLEKKCNKMSSEKSSLESALKNHQDELSRLREAIEKCDDHTGSDQEITDRLAKVKGLHEQVEEIKAKIHNTLQQASALHKAFPSTDTDAPVKDAELLVKRGAGLEERAGQVQTDLEKCLAQRLEDSKKAQEAWIKAAKEKADWVGKGGGEKHVIDAKLAALDDLINNLGEGEEKTEDLAERAIVMRKAGTMFSAARPPPADVDHHAVRSDFKQLASGLVSMRARLLGAMGEMQAFESADRKMADWMRDFEGQIKGLQKEKMPNLVEKEGLCKKLQDMAKITQDKQWELDQHINEAKKISESSGDKKLLERSAQSEARFKKIHEQLAGLISSAKVNVDEHAAYDQKRNLFTEWLKSAKQRLSQCEAMPSSNSEGAQKKLTELKKLFEEKPKGETMLVNSVVPAGEGLFPQTSLDGQSVLRSEMGDLQKAWEAYVDQLGDLQRQAESARVQWDSFDGAVSSMADWVSKIEGEVDQDASLKDHLPEKRAALQTCRNRLQDVLANERTINNLIDKGKTMGSTSVQLDLDNIKTNFAVILASAKKNVSNFTLYTADHQTFHDQLQAAQEWLSVQQEKLTICEDNTTDKTTILNSLNKITALFTQAYPTGEQLVNQACETGHKVLDQTAPIGCEVIRNDMGRIKSEFGDLRARASRLKTLCEDRLAILQTFEATVTPLKLWMKEVQEKLRRDQEMCATLGDKRAHLLQLEGMMEEVRSRAGEIKQLGQLVEGVGKIDGKMAEEAVVLTRKYEGLEAQVGDRCKVWEEYVKQHAEFDEELIVKCDQLLSQTQQKIQSIDSSMTPDKSDDSNATSSIKAKKAAFQTAVQSGIESCQAAYQQCVAKGESLYSSTTSPGRDVIRSQLRELRGRLDELQERADDLERGMDGEIYSAQVFEEGHRDLAAWLVEARRKLKELEPLPVTLEDKKKQIRQHKILQQDLQTHRTNFDSLQDKASKTGSREARLQAEDLLKGFNALFEDNRTRLDERVAFLRAHLAFVESRDKMASSLHNISDQIWASADTTGDKAALTIKLEKLSGDLKSLLAQARTEHTELDKLHHQAVNTVPSATGQIMTKEVQHLADELSRCEQALQTAISNMEEALSNLDDFEGQQERLEVWLKKLETSLKKYREGSSVEMKMQCLAELEAIDLDASRLRDSFTRFEAASKQTISSSNDLQLEKAISDLGYSSMTLKTNATESCSKWRQMIDNHRDYDTSFLEFNKSLDSLETKVRHLNNEPLESLRESEKSITIAKDILTNEIPNLSDQIHICYKKGELVIPDTSIEGRETIRSGLRSAKDRLVAATETLENVQAKHIDFSQLIETFSKVQHSLDAWLNKAEGVLSSQMAVEDLDQLPRRVEALESLSQEISQRRTDLYDIGEKAESLGKVSERSEEWESSARQLEKRYTNFKTEVKNGLKHLEGIVADLGIYKDLHHSTTEWLTSLEDKINTVSDCVGDKLTLQARAEKVQELREIDSDIDAKVNATETQGHKVLTQCDHLVSQSITKEVSQMQSHWHAVRSQIAQLDLNLSTNISQLRERDRLKEEINSYLVARQRQLKDFPIKSTIEEKRNTLKECKKLNEEIVMYNSSLQNKLDKISDITLNINGKSPSQDKTVIQESYDKVLNQSKTQIALWEEYISTHEDFLEKVASMTCWFQDSTRQLDLVQMPTRTKEEFDERLGQLHVLLSHHKTDGESQLSTVQDAGLGSLLTSTAPEGREVIRQQLRTLRYQLDHAIDAINQILVERGDVDEQLRCLSEQVEKLAGVATKLKASFPRDQLVLHDTLEEKRHQLTTYRTEIQHIQSHNLRTCSSLREKIVCLSQTGSTDHLIKRLDSVESEFEEVMDNLKNYVSRYEEAVRSHQQYLWDIEELTDWIKMMTSRSGASCNVKGDQHTVRSCLEQIEELISSHHDGQQKLDNLKGCAEQVKLTTAKLGKSDIDRKLADLAQDLATLWTSNHHAKDDLSDCLDKWIEHDKTLRDALRFIKDVELAIDQAELKPNLQQKLAQVTELEDLLVATTAKETEFKSWIDNTTSLVQLSSEKQLQITVMQTVARNKALSNTLRDLIGRWRNYASNHQSYIDSVEECEAVEERLSHQVEQCLRDSVTHDRSTTETKLSVLVLLSKTMANEGVKIERLEELVETVLGETEASTRGDLRAHVNRLKQKWEATASSVTLYQSQVQLLLQQWVMFEDKESEVIRSMADIEQKYKEESGEVDAKLEEKMSRSERLRRLVGKADGLQTSQIAQLRSNAEVIRNTSDSTDALERTSLMDERFQRLTDTVKQELHSREQTAQNHTIYQNAYAEFDRYLTITLEKVQSLADEGKTNRRSTEEQLSKALDMVKSNQTRESAFTDVKRIADIAMSNTNPSGQEIIRAEVDQLANKLHKLISNLEQQQKQLEMLNTQWHVFHRDYNTLSEWCKEMEFDLRSNLDFQTSLEQKENVYESQRRKQEVILAKESNFQALMKCGEILLKNSTDLRLNTQLSKLMANYNSLVALTNSVVKQCEQNASDHREYEGQLQEISAWLEDALQQLHACQPDETTDKFKAQLQLDKLRDLATRRDQGHALLENTISWAEKIKVSTSPKGQAVIEEDVKQLEADMSRLDAIGSIRENLETTLINLTEYSNTMDQMEKWIDDVTQRVSHKGVKKDIGDKLVQLQQAKGIVEEVITSKESFQQAMARFQPKAGADVEKAENNWKRYEHLVGAARALLTENECKVKMHQKYQQNLAELTAWFKTEKEALTSCSTNCDDVEVVKSNLEHARLLYGRLPQGTSMLRNVKQMNADIMNDTAPEGLPKLRSEVNKIEQNIVQYENQLIETIDNLDRCQNLWTSFNDTYDKMDDTLYRSEQFLSDELSFKANSQEKRGIAELYRRHHDELQEKKRNIESLNKVGSELFDLNAEPKVTQMMTQLNIRYQAQLNSAQDALKRLEHHHVKHAAFDKKSEEFIEWVKKNENIVSKATPAVSPKVNIRQLRADLAEIEHQYDIGMQKMTEMEELAEEARIHTNPSGVQAMEEQLNTMRQETNALKAQVNKRKEDVEKYASILQDCARSSEQLSDWLTSSESLLNSESSTIADIETKKATLHRLKALANELDSKKSSISRLQERSADLADPTIFRDSQTIEKRYRNLLRSNQRLMAKLDREVSGQLEFQAAQKECREWLNKAQGRLGQLTEEEGTVPEMEEKLVELRSFLTESQQRGRALVNTVIERSELLAAEDGDMARGDVVDAGDMAQNELAMILATAQQAEERVRDTANQCRNFLEECEQFAEWMAGMEPALTKRIELRDNYEARMKQVHKYKTIYEEISMRKSELERLQRKGTSLHEVTRDPQIANQVTQLHARYQTLVSNCKDYLENLNQQMEQVASNLSEYEDAYSSAEAWMEATTQKLIPCSDTSGSQEQILQKLAVCQELSNSLEHGQMLMDRTVDSANRAIKCCSVEAGRRVRGRVEQLKRDWSEVTQRVDDTGGKLNKAAARWQHYTALVDRTNQWLVAAESAIDQVTSKAEMGHRTQQFEKLRTMKRECESKENDIAKLQKLTDEVQVHGRLPYIAEENAFCRSRFVKVKNQIDQILTLQGQVEENYKAYQSAVHETERWILACSYRLMATNDAVHCPDLDTARAQLDRQVDLTSEMSDYRHNIDHLVRLGHRLIEENQLSPETLNQIQAQLNSVQDTFDNLTATSEQVKERLEDNVSKWKAYKDALEKGEEFLHGDLFGWWLDKESTFALGLDDLSEQITETKEKKRVLQNLRRQVSSCAHNCRVMSHSLDDSSSRLSSPATPPGRPSSLIQNPLPPGHPLLKMRRQMADTDPTVNSPEPRIVGQGQMQRQATKFETEAKENLFKLDRRLQSLNELKVRWDKWEHNRDDLHDWLHHKQVEVRDATVRPPAVNEDASRNEILRLEELRKEVTYMEGDLHKLHTTLDELTGHRGRDEVLETMNAEYAGIADHLSSHIASREGLLERENKRQSGCLWDQGLRNSNSLMLFDHADGEREDDDGEYDWLSGNTTPSDSSARRSHQEYIANTGTQTPCNHGTQTPGGHKKTWSKPPPTRESSRESLRNSGGNRGISKQLWPYNETPNQQKKRRTVMASPQRSHSPPTKGSRQPRIALNGSLSKQSHDDHWCCHTSSQGYPLSKSISTSRLDDVCRKPRASMTRAEALEELMTLTNPPLEDGFHYVRPTTSSSISFHDNDNTYQPTSLHHGRSMTSLESVRHSGMLPRSTTDNYSLNVPIQSFTVPNKSIRSRSPMGSSANLRLSSANSDSGVATSGGRGGSNGRQSVIKAGSDSGMGQDRFIRPCQLLLQERSGEKSTYHQYSNGGNPQRGRSRGVSARSTLADSAFDSFG